MVKAWIVPCVCGARTAMPPPGAADYVEHGSCIVCGKSIDAKKGAWLTGANEPPAAAEMDLLGVD